MIKKIKGLAALWLALIMCVVVGLIFCTMVVDLAMLTIHLLQDMLKVKPEAVMERFRFNDPTLTGEDFRELIEEDTGSVYNDFGYDASMYLQLLTERHICTK